MGGGKDSGSTVVRRSRRKPTRLSNKQIDAMTNAQLMKAARSAFIAKELATDAKYGQGKFTGKPITKEEASRRFDLMAKGKSMNTIRNYVKSNKSLVSADAIPSNNKDGTQKTGSAAKKNSTAKPTAKAKSKKLIKPSEIKSTKAPKNGIEIVVSIGNGNISVSRSGKSYVAKISPSLTKYSNGKSSFISRLWNEMKAFMSDMASLA